MRGLIKKILKESEDDFEWVSDLIPSDIDYEPGAVYLKFGGKNLETKNYILKKIVDDFSDLKLVGDRIILETDGWCDFVGLFYDDRRGSEGYINQYLAKQMLCEEDDWWEPYSSIDLVPNREWKTMLWDDYVMGNEKVIKEILDNIRKNYVSDVNYNPNQLDIFGELPKKQNVVEIRGRVLDTDYFYELTQDINELGYLIDKEEEFENLKNELRWAYGDAYNTAARDQIWQSTSNAIKNIFGEGNWSRKEIQKPSGVVTRHYMEFDVTNLVWSSSTNFFENCKDNIVGKQSIDDYNMEDLQDNFEECMSPAYQYGSFIGFYNEWLHEMGEELNPRYQEYPDDDDILKYFTESVMDRI